MKRIFSRLPLFVLIPFAFVGCQHASQLRTADGQPAQLAIRAAGDHSIRITLKPIEYEHAFPYSPAIAKTDYDEPAISLQEITSPIQSKVGNLTVSVKGNPLTVTVSNAVGKTLQELVLQENGSLKFILDEKPVLGMGEGGPLPEENWREQIVEFDRRGRYYDMRPRWQSDAYGSRNPVPLLVGTKGWGLFVAAPWVEVDLRNEKYGTFIPWHPPNPQDTTVDYNRLTQGKPPVESMVPGLLDVFVFDASAPAQFLKDLSTISGPAVMPPKWAFGYMQSHRTLVNDQQMVNIVDTFREKEIPIDAVIYLGTGFCPRGWNTEQPSLTFNPEVFERDPVSVIRDLHERNVKMVVHVVPWQRDRLPTLQGTIPPEPDEVQDASRIVNYWQQHIPLMDAGVDAFWPDEGDWFNLYERVKRHQLYYQGPLSTQPNVRPWSLHRNGYLGIAHWGGWVWSGDTESSWKTLEAQIAVGINHSLSLSPYWGSDIGGFYPNAELTGELYARWFQFGAFCPSFRAHGRTWWTRLPWGWGLNEMGPLEDDTNPLPSSLNNDAIEPVCRKYADLRYQLMPYTYTLAWQARETGMPCMRALWLHYPDDAQALAIGDQFLWGEDMLIAPVFEKNATSRTVYLPAGIWYDWWTHEKLEGGKTITRSVDLATLPIYAKAGAIVPFDPVKQYTSAISTEPTTIKVFTGDNGAFTWYEDDGISLDYLKGDFQLTGITWDDSTKKLSIQPEGKHKGKPRTLIVQLVKEDISKSITYQGEPVSISF